MEKPIRALAISGGGVRLYAALGALKAGVETGALRLEDLDCITGDSSGALLAALVACGWSIGEMEALLLGMDLRPLITPWPSWTLRKGWSVVQPVSLLGLARFIDGLRFPPAPRLVVNAWDAQENRQVLFCQQMPAWAQAVPQNPATRWQTEAFATLGYGRVLTRSMALPGLAADEPRWMDGALGEHPPLECLPVDTRLTVINLGFAGLVMHRDTGGGLADTVPRGLLGRALYAYEVTASINQRRALARFAHLRHIEPKVYDVDSINFSLSRTERRALIERGLTNTLSQWQASMREGDDERPQSIAG